MLQYSLLSFFLFMYHIQEILLSHFSSALLIFESNDCVCLALKKKKKAREDQSFSGL